MSNYGMDVDAFLDHSAHGSGGGATYFRKWKEDGKAIVWLNQQAGFIAKWSHGWPRIVELKDRDTAEKRIEVWQGSWNCWESEPVLRRQNFRDEHDSRELPPEACPLCKMIEVVRALVSSGDLNLWDPIFRFEGAIEQYDVMLTAGGIYNAFRKDGKGALPPALQAECRKHGIRFDEAWKENTKARCGYTFVVVDNAHPENGVQIADEREALGQKMQRAIRDEIDRRGGGDRGRTLGNPLRTPYPFLWEYDKDASFSDKYRVVALTGGEPALSDEIHDLIAGPPPDLEKHMRPGNAKLLRADMERCALVKLPFDEIFAEAERRGGGADDDEDNPIGKAIEEVRNPAPAARTPEVTSRRAAPAPVPVTEDEFECDHCGGVLKGTDFECPHCGAGYDERGLLTTRPCAKCKTQVPLEGTRSICPKCATIHDTNTWEVVQPVATPPRRRSRAQAPIAQASTDTIPFGGGARKS